MLIATRDNTHAYAHSSLFIALYEDGSGTIWLEMTVLEIEKKDEKINFVVPDGRSKTTHF